MSKTHFMVRTEDGKYRTVVAQSHKGAMRQFLEQYDAEPGDELDVKRRGDSGETWQRFRVK